MQCHRVSFSVSIFVNYNKLPDEIQNMPAKQRICQKVDEDFLIKCGQVVLYKLYICNYSSFMKIKLNLYLVGCALAGWLKPPLLAGKSLPIQIGF